MGGVIIRYAIEVLAAGEHVDTAVTIASPHAGSVLANLACMGPVLSLTRSAAQLRVGNRFLDAIEAAAEANAVHASAEEVRWIAYHSNTDMIVGTRSALLRTGRAENRLVRNSGHVAMLASRPV